MRSASRNQIIRERIFRMKATRFIPVFIILSLCLLTACGGGGTTVSTDGSTSMERIMGALTEGYREVDSAVTVNYSGTGSGAGIEAVLSGVCDIGLSSRALKQSEIEQGAQGHLIALDGIAVIVNPTNPVSDLTREELADIFSGRISNWAQVGGADAPIAVFGREAGSGTRDAFEERIDLRDIAVYTNIYSSTGDIVGSITANPNAIGYISLAGVRYGVRALSVDGIACSEETLRSGQYTISRPFLFVTDANRPLSPAARAFLDYAMSGSVRGYISLAGAVAP